MNSHWTLEESTTAPLREVEIQALCILLVNNSYMLLNQIG
jgi:hypothetical protein